MEPSPEELIWNGRSKELLHRPTIDPKSWSGAIQADLVAANPTRLPSLMRKPPERMVHLDVAAIMMVKNEQDIITDNLCWLEANGVSRFIIIDNNSTDHTRQAIEIFRKDHQLTQVLIVDDPIVMYAQARKMTGIFRLGMSLWPEVSWFLPVDADEFFIFTQSLSALNTIDEHVDAVVIPKVNHYIERSSHHSGETEFAVYKRMPLRTDLFRAPPKVLVRARQDVQIGPGNHFCLSSRPLVYVGGLSIGCYIREFSIRGFEEFCQKILQGGPAILAAEDNGLNVGGAHWKKRYEVFRQRGFDGLREMFSHEFEKNVDDTFFEDPFDPRETLKSV